MSNDSDSNKFHRLHRPALDKQPAKPQQPEEGQDKK